MELVKSPVENKRVLSLVLNDRHQFDDVTSDGKLFQVLDAATTARQRWTGAQCSRRRYRSLGDELSATRRAFT